MTDRRPRRLGTDPVLRALAVVALVVVAALALRARQGLDWGRLADPVEVRWARVLLGSVVLLVLIAAARRLLAKLRAAASASAVAADDEHAEPEGEPFPFLLRVLAVLLVLATLAAVYFVLSSIHTPPPAEIAGGGAQQRRPGSPPPHLDTGATWGVLLVVGAVLLAGALGSRWLAARRVSAADADPAAEQEAEVQRLVAAVDAAGAGLRSHADPRAAVLAAYAAMAGQLTRGLARRGRAARRSDTATELLDHAVEVGLVSGSPARTLTELFREARYSTHPMGEQARATALDCLARVRGELTARRG